MQGMSITNIGLFIVVIIAQALALSILPRTNAFMVPIWTLVCLGASILSMWLLALMFKTGVPLSNLIPILAATVPLVTVLVGVFVYKEPASAMKLVMLLSACGLIGVASALK